MTNVPVKRGEAARQQPQVAVTDADREAAITLDALIGTRFNSASDPQIVEWCAQAIARARAEGAASEREHCAAVADRWANSTSCRHHDDLPCCHVRTGVAIAAAIRARSEGGKA